MITRSVLVVVSAALVPLAPGADPAAASSPPVTISLQLSRGRVLVPVRINGSSALAFMLDSGFSLTMISPQQAEALQLKRSGEVTIAGIAGDEQASVFGGATIDLSGAK